MYAVLAKIYLMLNYNNNTSVTEVANDIANGGSAAGAIEDFNNFLLNMLIYAGSIILAIAIVKLVIALQQQDSHSKMQASLLFGLGAAFVASNAIIQAIDIKNNINNSSQIVINMAEVAGTVLRLVALILLAISIVQMILSFINEDGAQKADAGKLMAIGGVLYAIRSVLVEAVTYALQPSGMSNITKLIINTISAISRFIGLILGLYGLFHVLLAFKDHDSTQLQRNIVLLTVGIILIMTKAIFNVFGLG